MLLVAAIQKLPITQVHEVLELFDKLYAVVDDAMKRRLQGRANMSSELTLTLKEAMTQLNPSVLIRQPHQIEMQSYDETIREADYSQCKGLVGMKKENYLWRLARLLNISHCSAQDTDASEVSDKLRTHANQFRAQYKSLSWTQLTFGKTLQQQLYCYFSIMMSVLIVVAIKKFDSEKHLPSMPVISMY